MLKIKDLSYSYGSIQTLNSVDMEMETGKVTCILGRNGVGKTTLLKNIMGVLSSSGGSIRQDDVYLTNLPPHLRASALSKENVLLSSILFLLTGGIWGLVWQARQFRMLNARLGRKESSFQKWYVAPLGGFIALLLVSHFFVLEWFGVDLVGRNILQVGIQLFPFLFPITFGVYHVVLHYSTARGVLDTQKEMSYPVNTGLPRKIALFGSLGIVGVYLGVGGIVLLGLEDSLAEFLFYLPLTTGLVSKIILQKEINKLFEGMSIGQKDTVGLGYVPQGRQIFPRITVEQNLKVALKGRRDGSKVIPEYVYELFPVLQEMGGRMGGDLSGGQQQQLAIARALCGDPEILVLDEPTEGIQPNIIQQIGEILRKLVEERGMTVVLVEQYLDFVKEFGHNFYVLNRGRVVAEGATSDLSDEIISKHLSV